MCLIHEAYENKDEPALVTGRDLILWLMEQQELLISSYPWYRIEWLAKHFDGQDKPLSLEDIRKTIRINIVHPQRSILDYPNKDVYEAIKFYYKPRLKWSLDHVLQCFRDHQPAPTHQDHLGRNFDFRDDWAEKGYDPAMAIPYEGNPLDAIKIV